jgi:DNA-binding GntR family transcriptional regulator
MNENGKPSVTAEERANQAIVALIINHKYLPGEKLYEVDLAQELGMSRTPIRNALRKLAAEGFLEMRANKGCSVPFLTLDDMEKLFKFRAELEGIASYEAAHRITEEDIQEMQKLLEMEKSIYSQADVLSYNNVNEKIHNLIIDTSGNTHLIRAARSVFLRSKLYIFYYDRFCREKEPKPEYIQVPGKHNSLVEHGKILRAFIEKEPEMARIVAMRHIQATAEQLREAFFISGEKMFDF